MQQTFFCFAVHTGLVKVQMQTQDIEEKADQHKNFSSLQKHTLVVDKCSATLSSVQKNQKCQENLRIPIRNYEHISLSSR